LSESIFSFHEQLILVKRFLRSGRLAVQFPSGISEFFTTVFTTTLIPPKSAWHTPTSSSNSTVIYLERPIFFCCTRNCGLSMELKVHHLNHKTRPVLTIISWIQSSFSRHVYLRFGLKHFFPACLNEYFLYTNFFYMWYISREILPLLFDHPNNNRRGMPMMRPLIR